jgi:hypothetical protein
MINSSNLHNSLFFLTKDDEPYTAVLDKIRQLFQGYPNHSPKTFGILIC